MTGPELFAIALSGRRCTGPHRCFWCGSPCDETHPQKSPGTFHDWDVVSFPSSRFACHGCAEALEEKRSLPGKDKPQKTRNYSWHITASKATPYTKADLITLRDLCLSPPSEPWALAIAESGQKHILFRTPVNTGDAPYRVQLELTTVEYHPAELADRLTLCGRICAAIGKPVLSGSLDLSAAMRYAEHHGHESLSDVERWSAVWHEPVSRLAAFLAPAKEEALREYPGHAGSDTGRVSPKARRSGRRSGDRSLFA